MESTTMRLVTILSWLLVVVYLAYAQPIAGDQDSESSSGCRLLVLDQKLQKSVCVCDATYCDHLVSDWPQNPGDAVLVQSSKDGMRFFSGKLENSHPNDSRELNVTRVHVNLATERQSILGFGGAFTDAAGYNIRKVSKELQRLIMESYFGEHGSQYTFGRVVIGGADFSTRPYSYDDRPPNSTDFGLAFWSLAPEDYHYKIPFIKEAAGLVSLYNSSLSLYGSSWSPPAFMKTSKSLVRGHLLKDDLVYKSYAQYLIKFYEAYKKEGISFWGGTVQNEPVSAYSDSYNFNSLQMSSEEAIRFVANYLGPALVANGYTKENFKLMINDDNIDALLDQAPTIMADDNVRKYVAGLAYHWYNSGRVPYDVLSECYEKVKDKIEFMMSTEACVEPGKEKPVDLGSWERAERYAIDIIEGLNRHSSGWVDWNLVLDEKGAPNWIHNFVDSPVIISDDKTMFYKQPMYYVLAHFSRFLRPKSVVIGVTGGGSLKSDSLLVTGAIKKDTGHLVINILNKSDQDHSLGIKYDGYEKIFTTKARSLNTFVAKL